MTQYTEPRATDLEERKAKKAGTRLAFENAYRLKKKALISEIERSLGLSDYDAVPSLSGT
jgi:hypothetical protein